MFFSVMVSLAASAQIGRTSAIKPYLTLPYLVARLMSHALAIGKDDYWVVSVAWWAGPFNLEQFVSVSVARWADCTDCEINGTRTGCHRTKGRPQKLNI
jgi:hypothetical protein